MNAIEKVSSEALKAVAGSSNGGCRTESRMHKNEVEVYRIFRKWTQLKHRTRDQDEQYAQRSGDESRD